ncbi:MAG: nitrous oxide reductase accessory protein NosL [Proteobacteria bacterium]|nr:nitrous oxide reductase accessory protein NosL [Pseudomonadota bacterium]MBU1738575.1 nitrous oxide reductase accessory protein NosL [Pseudomonadota bacterium]
MADINSKHTTRKANDGKRVAIITLIVLFLAVPILLRAGSAPRPEIDHPVVKPHVYTRHLRCVNCGMKLNMWARTRHSFTLSSGEYHTCSIHCVADLARQHKESAKNVKVALYLEPETMLEADQAFYLVGSTAVGTMTAVSKIAFRTEKSATDFANKYGGSVMNFAEVLARASEEL